MRDLKDNQIMLEISEDKKKVTVTVGQYQSISFDICPNEPTANLGTAIKSYFDKTGLERTRQWKSDGCFYKGTGTCKECT